MSSRRNFLTKSTLATFAFAMFKPNPVISKILSTSKLIKKDNQLTILCGNDIIAKKAIIKNIGHHVLDLSIPNANQNVICNNNDKVEINNLLHYEIEMRSSLKTGIIHLIKDNQSYYLNNTAAFLKKELGCHLIICVCQHQLNNQTDNFFKEIELAKSSSDIDLIVCHKQNALRYKTHIAHNINKHEVIIKATFGNVDTSIGKIDICFNDALQKINIAC